MTKHAIPAEAVDAAARALWQTNQHDDVWAGEFHGYMDYLRSEATKALEAAAPYIRSHSWDDGYNKGKSDATDTTGYHVNPDRKYL